MALNYLYGVTLSNHCNRGRLAFPSFPVYNWRFTGKVIPALLVNTSRAFAKLICQFGIVKVTTWVLSSGNQIWWQKGLSFDPELKHKQLLVWGKSLAKTAAQAGGNHTTNKREHQRWATAPNLQKIWYLKKEDSVVFWEALWICVTAFSLSGST